MRSFYKLMPWSLVVWLSRRYCETVPIDGQEYVRPFKGGPALSKRDY